MRIIAALILTAALSGCSGGSEMPPGFNEACYGGDFGKNLAGAKPLYSSTLSLTQDSRPALRKALFELAEKHQMKAFDDGAEFKNQFFSIYLCSAKGAFAVFDSRAAGKDMVRIDVFSYRQSWQPATFVKDLQVMLSARWPNGVKEMDTANTTLGNSLL